MITPTTGKSEAHYRPLPHDTTPSGPWDAIIIGTGIGGMACAAALSQYGRRCLLLEQHAVPGGLTQMFTRKGFNWDVGVHSVGEMGPKDIAGKLFAWLSDGGMKWQHVGRTHERFFFPEGFDIECPSDPKGLRAVLNAKFPGESESIDRYFHAVKAATAEATRFFACRALPSWVGRAGRRLRPIGRKTDYWRRTTDEVLRPLVPNPRLRAVLTGQWGYYGSTPGHSSFAIHAMTVAHFAKGGYYPVGGSRTIAENLLRTVSQAGGETYVRAPVAEIVVEGRNGGRAVGVRMHDGREFRAPKIISAAGARLTVDHLLVLDTATGARRAWSDELRSLRQSPAHICLYLGIEGDLRAAGGTPASQWFMESWDMEIGDWDVNDPKSIAPILFVSFPTLKDPAHVSGPRQRHTAEVVTFVRWRAFEQWRDTRWGRRSQGYLDFKKSIEDRLVAQLQRHIPEVLAIATYRELSTPLSTVHFTHAAEGATYGLAATPRRVTSTHLQVRTPIKNLFMAGGDVTAPGVTGALLGGVLAAGAVEPSVLARVLSL